MAPPEETEEQDLSGEWTISGKDLLNVLWPILLADQAKLQALASNPTFIKAVLASEQFCAGVSKTAATAATTAVGQAMGA